MTEKYQYLSDEDKKFSRRQQDETGTDNYMDNDHYSNKGSHKLRSIFNQPRHKKHWKKK